MSRKIKFRIEEILYLSAYIPWMFVRLLYTTRISVDYRTILDTMSRASVYLVFLILVPKLIIDCYKYRKVSVNTLFITPLLLIVGINTNQLNSLLCIWLLVIGIKNVDLRKVLKTHIVLMTIVLIMVPILLHYNLLTTLTQYRGLLVREYMGYIYSTFANNLIFHYTCIIVFLRGKKITILELVAIFLLNLYYFNKTDTRSAYYLTTIIIVIVMIVNILKIRTDYSNKLLIRLQQFSVPILAVILYVLSRFYNPSNFLMYKLNEAVSWRISLSNSALTNYGIKLFGQRISWTTFDSDGILRGVYDYVDPSYLKILIVQGLVFFVLLAIGFYLLPKYNSYKSVFFTISILFIFAHSMWDPQLFEIWFNPFLIFIGLVLTEEPQVK